MSAARFAANLREGLGFSPISGIFWSIGVPLVG